MIRSTKIDGDITMGVTQTLGTYTIRNKSGINPAQSAQIHNAGRRLNNLFRYK